MVVKKYKNVAEVKIFVAQATSIKWLFSLLMNADHQMNRGYPFMSLFQVYNNLQQLDPHYKVLSHR